MLLRRAAVGYLLLQALGASAWWVMLLGWPTSRKHFLASGAPDATLLAFGLPDAILYMTTSLATAYGLATKRVWAWPLLLIHAGAAAYAGLYCWALTAITGGDGLWGALLMTPSVIIPGVLTILLKPRGEPC
ncbi:MAG: hypothetical protein ACRC8S_15170 [Fimbriiglobus sp.]